MIKPPSVQSEYSWIWSADPALALPEDETAREHALQVARDTGDWSALIRPGDTPTVFTLAPVSRQQMSWIMGEAQHSSWLERPLAPMEINDLLVRVALRRVDGFGEYKVVRTRHKSGHFLAEQRIIDALAETAGTAVVDELAAHILKRSESQLRPL